MANPKIQVAWNKGKKCPQISKSKKGIKFTDEHKKNLRKSHIGLKYPNRKKGLIPWNKGKKEERLDVIEKIRNAHKGYVMPEKQKKKIGKGNKLKYQQGRQGYWLGKKGSKSPNWKNGKTDLRRMIESLFEYRQWRSDIFTRDNFTCQKCTKRGGKLNAHHIKAFSKIISENNIKTVEQALNCEELWNINNGETLCEECHKQTDNYGMPKKITI